MIDSRFNRFWLAISQVSVTRKTRRLAAGLPTWIDEFEPRLLLTALSGDIETYDAAFPIDLIGTSPVPVISPVNNVQAPSTLAIDLSGTPIATRASGDATSTDFNDVKQGALDTCVFNSVLSSVAIAGTVNLESGITSTPAATQTLRSAVALTDSVSPMTAAATTIYHVRLYQKNSQGSYVPVLIDVPFDGTVNPEDSRPGDGDEFWTLLYQRAYLTFEEQKGGNYHTYSEAIPALIGQTPEQFSVAGASLSTAQRIATALNTGRAVDAATVAGTADLLLAGSGGLAHNHSYSVIGIEIPSNGNLAQTFVTLRNPWGSDTSAKYFDADNNGQLSLGEWVDSQYGLDGRDDGILRISWQKFTTFLDAASIYGATGPSVNQPLKADVLTFTNTNVGPFTVHEGELLGPIVLTATDARGNHPFYGLSDSSPGNIQLQNGTYTWTPPSGSVGQYTVTVTAEVSPFETASKTFVVNVISGAPVIASMTASPGSITNSGNDLVTLTAQNVSTVVGHIDSVEFWRDADGDGAFDPAKDILLGTGTSSGSNSVWTGYVGGLTVGTDKFFSRARRFSTVDLHYSNVVSSSVTVTAAPVIPAVAVPVAGQFMVNSTLSFSQMPGDVERDSQGNFRIFWTVYHANGTNDIMMRQYNSSGVALTNPVVALSANAVYDTAMLSDGSFVIALNEDANLSLQWFNSSGVAVGSRQTVTTDAWSQNSYVQVDADQNGNLMLVYNKGDYFSEDVWAASVTRSGTVTRAPWLVNSHTNSMQKYPTVALNASGDGVVAWFDFDQGKLIARQVSNYGVSNSAEITVANTAQADTTITSAISNSGQFTIAWPSDAGLKARRYNSNGQAAGAEFSVGTSLAGAQVAPKVAVNDLGWSVICWTATSRDQGANAGQGMYAQMYDPTGASVGPDFAVPSNTQYDQLSTGVILDADSDPTFVWSNGFFSPSITTTVQARQFKVNLAPQFTSNDDLALDENSPIGSVVGGVPAADPDSDPLAYSFASGNVNGTFAINPSTGQITIANSTSLDFETTPVFNLAIRIQDPSGLAATRTQRINLVDVNEQPGLNDLAFVLNENSANQTPVGQIAGTDPDNDLLTYSIASGNSNGAFSINPATGLINVANGSLLNFETGSAVTLTIVATDPGGLSQEAQVLITLANINEAPTDIALSSTDTAENNIANAIVGTLNAIDSDSNDSFTFALAAGTGSTDNGSFSISSNSLSIIPVANFEAKASYSIRVQVTDLGGLTYEKTFTINITNVNESPVIPSGQAFTTPASSNAGIVIGTVNATDPDTSGPNSTKNFSITGGNASGVFSINPQSGQVAIANASALPALSGQVIVLEITETDGGSPALSGVQTVSVTVASVNSPPVLANPGTAPTFNGKLKSAVNVVPTLIVTDADGDATLASIVINLPLAKAKKNPDIVTLPGLSSIGTRTDTVVSGRLQISIALKPGTTNSAVQAMLQGMTFKTSGAGLNILNRDIRLKVTDRSGLQSNVVTQDVGVRKK